MTSKPLSDVSDRRDDVMDILRRPLRSIFEIVERVLDRVVGERWNPFYFLGALGYFYFWIVAASGVYIYVFFETSIPGAYNSVEALTHGQWYLGGVMRSAHRYASDALVAMMVLHGLRVFAYDKYRGARWFTWVTGLPVIGLVFAAGVTGYWLVWDRLAQFVAIKTTEWLDWLPIFGEPIARNFLSKAHLDGRFFTLILFMHIALPLFLLFVLWFHLQRVSNAQVNPPRGLAISTLLMMLGLSLVYPAQSQGIADLSRVIGEINFDWYYLWLYPLVAALSPGTVWGMMAIGIVIFLALPFLPPRARRPVAVVDLDNCNGCTRCVADCPFEAIEMQPRTDGKPFELQAVVDSDLCVSCGICMGSCPTATPFRSVSNLNPGIAAPDMNLRVLYDRVSDAAPKGLGPRGFVFGCDHGADVRALASERVGVASLSCIGALPPSFIDYVLSRNIADHVVIAGCPPGACHYRLGAQWVDERIAGTRDPRLRARVERDRVTVVRASPHETGSLARQVDALLSQAQRKADKTDTASDKSEASQ